MFALQSIHPIWFTSYFKERRAARRPGVAPMAARGMIEGAMRQLQEYRTKAGEVMKNLGCDVTKVISGF